MNTETRNIQKMKMWNFLFGCTKCSDACLNCYGITRCWRFMHNPNMKGRADGTVERDIDDEGVFFDWTGRVNYYVPATKIPMRIKKPTRFFVNAFSDTFHEKAAWDYIDYMITTMRVCKRHEFYIPTKRIDKAAYDLNDYTALPNVWILYSAWDQESFDAGLVHAMALNNNGWKVGCSLEPLLAPVDVKGAVGNHKRCDRGYCHLLPPGPCAESSTLAYNCRTDSMLDLVIVGPERAGNRSRPCKREWIDSVVAQCNAAGVEIVDKTNPK